MLSNTPFTLYTQKIEQHKNNDMSNLIALEKGMSRAAINLGLPRFSWRIHSRLPILAGHPNDTTCTHIVVLIL